MNCGCRRTIAEGVQVVTDEVKKKRDEARRLEHYDVYQKGYQAGRESIKPLIKKALHLLGRAQMRELTLALNREIEQFYDEASKEIEK